MRELLGSGSGVWKFEHGKHFVHEEIGVEFSNLTLWFGQSRDLRTLSIYLIFILAGVSTRIFRYKSILHSP